MPSASQHRFALGGRGQFVVELSARVGDARDAMAPALALEFAHLIVEPGVAGPRAAP